MEYKLKVKKKDSADDLNQNNVDMLLHENEEKNKKKALPYGLQQKALDDAAKLNEKSKTRQKIFKIKNIISNL